MAKKIFPVCALLILLTFCSGTGYTEGNYIPFDRNSMVLMLKKAVNTKFIPCELPKNEGVSLTITALKNFSVNWNNGQLSIRFAFESQYKLGFLPVRSTGEMNVTGNALFNSREQKIGLRLLAVQDLKMDRTNRFITEIIRKMLDKKISGHEIWPGSRPSESRVMTGENFPALLSVAVSRMLPYTAENERVTITLTDLHKLNLLKEAGSSEVNFTFNGTYRFLTRVSFAGQMGVQSTIMVNPDDLSGKIRIESITALDLDNTMSSIDKMVRRWADARLKGKVIDFKWK